MKTNPGVRMHYRLRARVADQLMSRPIRHRFVSETDVVVEMESMEAREQLFALAQSSSDRSTSEPTLVSYS